MQTLAPGRGDPQQVAELHPGALVRRNDVRLDHDAHVLLEHERRMRLLDGLARSHRGGQQADSKPMQQPVVDGQSPRVDHLGGVEDLLGGRPRPQDRTTSGVGLERDVPERSVQPVGLRPDEDGAVELAGVPPPTGADLGVDHISRLNRPVGEVLPRDADIGGILGGRGDVREMGEPAAAQRRLLDQGPELVLAHPGGDVIDQVGDRRIGQGGSPAQPLEFLGALSEAQPPKRPRDIPELPSGQLAPPGQVVVDGDGPDVAERARAAGGPHDLGHRPGRAHAPPPGLDSGHLAGVRHMIVRLREEDRIPARRQHHVVVAVAEEPGEVVHVRLIVAGDGGGAVHGEDVNALARHHGAGGVEPTRKLRGGEARVARLPGRRHHGGGAGRRGRGPRVGHCHLGSPVHRPSLVIAAVMNPSLMSGVIVPSWASVSNPASTRVLCSPSFTGQTPRLAISS